MAKRRRRALTAEFKTEAVRLAKAGDRTIGQVAADLDLTESALRNWLKQADVDAGDGVSDALTTAEKAELTELRRESLGSRYASTSSPFLRRSLVTIRAFGARLASPPLLPE